MKSFDFDFIDVGFFPISALKHSPSKKGKRESIKKRINSEKENNDQGGQGNNP